MTFSFFVGEACLSNYADDTALYFVQKKTSLTNLFLRKISCIYRNGLKRIIWSQIQEDVIA